VAAPEPATAAVVPTLPVHVNATPWARIEVDGQSLGETPLAGIPLTPGDHHFRATFPDGRVVERDVHIDARNHRVVFR
jgi:serine/threonine-protein kinase